VTPASSEDLSRAPLDLENREDEGFESASAPKGRFDTGSLHVFYRQTPIPVDAFAGAGESIARRLAEGAAGGDLAAAFRGWVREARGRSP
jgi:hypothetical protein